MVAIGTVHHVISRFVDRTWQLAGDVERDAYLARLGYALARTDWVLLGYALMSSHVHLVLEAGAAPLGSWTKSAHSRTARWLNARHGRLGPVFADRPYVEAVDDSRIPYLLAYVHNNPVRARLVRSADECSWTSHQAYLGLTPARAGLSTERGLSRSGFGGDATAFDAWVRSCVGNTDFSRAAEVARQARTRARQQGGSHVEIATPQQGTDGMRAAVVVPLVALWRAHPSRITPEGVIAVVQELTGIDPRGRAARDRRPAVTAARRAALAAWTHIGGTRIQMARSLGIGAAAASDLLHRRPQRLQMVLVDDVLARLCREGDNVSP